MKKWITILMVAVLGISLMACGQKQEESKDKPAETQASAGGEEVELFVFAAASMTETMNELAEKYKEIKPNVKLTYTFDSSGTLKTQIEEGAEVDVFISAAQKQMNALDIKSDKNEKKLDFIDSDSRINLLENKVTLAVAKGNPTGISGFNDINTEKVKTIALGNADVPVGQYSEELFKTIGVWDQIQPKITFGSNVKEVTTWVSEGVVDCGVVYATDAHSAGLEVVDKATKEQLKTAVIYPAAVLKNSKHAEEAKEFLAFLQTEDSVKVFENVGFSPAK